jgi:hypothetical protein
MSVLAFSAQKTTYMLKLNLKNLLCKPEFSFRFTDRKSIQQIACVLHKPIMYYRDKSFHAHFSILFTFGFSIKTRKQNRGGARAELSNKPAAPNFRILRKIGRLTKQNLS